MPPMLIGRSSWGFCPGRLGAPISPSTTTPSRSPYCRTRATGTYASSWAGTYRLAGLRRKPWPSRMSSKIGIL